MKVHPTAELFPMMTDEELEGLAEDIAANGLIHPIIIDDEKQIVDGRNRLKACKLAQVEPTFEQLNGRDPLALIVSANLARRNLTKGQQAMAMAMIYPQPEKGGRGKKSLETSGFSQQRLSQARSILRQSSDLAKAVMKGSMSLDAALVKVEELQQQAKSTDAKLARLQQSAPDLAVRVTDENIRLDEAIAILNEREAEQRRMREQARCALDEVVGRFTSNVAAIHSGIEAGEDLRLEPKIMKNFQKALELFMRDMQRKE